MGAFEMRDLQIGDYTEHQLLLPDPDVTFPSMK
jgi:hypothetical protein